MNQLEERKERNSWRRIGNNEPNIIVDIQWIMSSSGNGFTRDKKKRAKDGWMADCILCFAIAIEWAIPSCQSMVMAEEERRGEGLFLFCVLHCIALHSNGIARCQNLPEWFEMRVVGVRKRMFWNTVGPLFTQAPVAYFSFLPGTVLLMPVSYCLLGHCEKCSKTAKTSIRDEERESQSVSVVKKKIYSREFPLRKQ